MRPANDNGPDWREVRLWLTWAAIMAALVGASAIIQARL